MRTGSAELPLHYGAAPRWLFSRMSRLAGEIAEAVILEHGTRGLLERFSDPFWFQALGCVLGFDWHSSGLTTTTCGALKEAVKGREEELGLFVAGGKGATSRKTPSEIVAHCERTGSEPASLVYASKAAAKVDSAAVQDGYQLYHHVFLFDRDANWAVVQQGMSDATRMARRYHWLSTGVRDFVCEPHAAICSDARGATLNLVAQESEGVRRASAEAARRPPGEVMAELLHLRRLDLPRRHAVSLADIDPTRLERILLKTYVAQPTGFEALLSIGGVGAKTVRALSLVSELIYGESPSFEDPARYSFAHGGKDGTPYPVDRVLYDRTIELLGRAIRRAKLDHAEELRALKRLERAFAGGEADASVRQGRAARSVNRARRTPQGPASAARSPSTTTSPSLFSLPQSDPAPRR